MLLDHAVFCLLIGYCLGGIIMVKWLMLLKDAVEHCTLLLPHLPAGSEMLSSV